MNSVHSRRYKKFLVRLRRARKESGLTQQEVALDFKVPQSWVSKCESGERRVDVIELQNFALIYKKPITFFLSSKDD